MIRPLIFCENAEQIESSINTIHTRIKELLELESSYKEKLKELTASNSQHNVSSKITEYCIHEK